MKTKNPSASISCGLFRADYLRTLFVGGAQAILQHPRNWQRYRFGCWLMTAAPRLHRNVLAAALANKLARIAWSVLYRERGYDAGIATQVP